MSGFGRRLLVKTVAVAGGKGIVVLFALLASRCSQRASAAESQPEPDHIASAARAREAHIADCESVRQACLAARPAAHTEARYAKWQGCENDYAACEGAPADAR